MHPTSTSKCSRTTTLRRALLVLVSTAAVTVPMPPAAHAATSLLSVEPDRHCAALAQPSSTADEHTRVEACSVRSPGHARKLLDRKVAHHVDGEISAQGGTLLVRFYEHANYDGSSSSVYGYAGPCDSTGYSIYVNTTWYQWGDVMSSIWGYNSCNRARLVHQNGVTAGYYRLPIWNLGYYNDNVQFLRVYKG